MWQNPFFIKERKIMRRIWMWIVGTVLMSTYLIQAQPVEQKAIFFKRLAEKQAELQEISGRFEINMNIMGNNMRIPVKFWNKSEKMRMDIDMSMPGMPSSMEQVIILDSKQLIQYQKMINTVMTADLTRMSEEVRKKIRENQSSMFGWEESISILKKIEDNVEIEEKNRDGKKFYLLTVKDFNKLQNMPSIGGNNSKQMFKKMLLWVDYDSLLPVKMEIYGEAETPGISIDFLELKTGKVSDDVFHIKFPEDVKYMDITDMVNNMFKGMKVPGTETQ